MYASPATLLSEAAPITPRSGSESNQSRLSVIDRASNVTLGVVDRTMNPRWLLPSPQTAGGETQNFSNSAPSTVAPNVGAVSEFAANLSIIKWTPESANVVSKNVREQFKAVADQVEELRALAKSGAPHVDPRSGVGRPLLATLWATQGAKDGE